MKSIGFLGPPGTFSEVALKQVLNGTDEEIDIVPYSSVPDVISAVEKDEVRLGFVPIENSIEGSVNITVDMLAFHADLLIVGETQIPIRQNLIGTKGAKLNSIKTVFSHPHAKAQCREFLSSKLQNVRLIAADSTSEAVKMAAEGGAEDAAIGTELAAQLYGLEVLQSDIQNTDENITRFVFLGKTPAKKSGNDKTSIVCSIYQDRPGSLLQILQEFAFRYINLTKIESRPAKRGLGEYIFIIDMEGHIDDEILSSALKCLECKIKNIKFLGSYPRARSASLMREILAQLR